MTCVELQKSLAETENGSTPEQRAHLKNCRSCSALVDELALIIAAAPTLLETDEPSPRVWNSIEIQLRQEGLIRPQRPQPSAIIPSLAASASISRWGWARLLVPATALLILIGIYVNQRSRAPQQIAQEPLPAITSDASLAGLNDDELLQEVSNQSPVIRAQYADNLRRVNDYIVDAKRSVDADPYDEDARRSLMEAYQQKSMLFELAVDRSLP
jgi:hypothetical protein